MADTAELAIGLAGTVLKFVIFSIDFVSEAKQVYKHGGTDRNLDLALVVGSIEDTTARLEHQLGVIKERGSGLDGWPDPEEQQLQDLSRRASEIGRELARKLRKVTTDEKSRWKSLKAVVLRVWDPDDIEETEKRLKSIRDEIHLTILVNIRSKVGHFSNDDDNARMLGTLEDIAGQQAKSRADSRHLIEMLITAEQASKGRYEELREQNNRLLKTIHSMTVSRSTTLIPADTAAMLEDRRRCQAGDRAVLSCLWYVSMHDRQESISEAHKKTFQWIFEDPKAREKPWDSFLDYLRGNNRKYWVTGKPGSGKSTLMKYIYHSPRTRALLQEWAGGDDLIMASFYFFYKGGEDQKTELGMVRSLLHSILDERREFIPIAFKERFEAAYEGMPRYDEPSLVEAKRALKNLISNQKNLKFFIIIDGLDEFDPAVSHTSVQSLIDFTHFLGEYENIKVLLSSRPLCEFEHGYSGCPTMRIHDLTKDDIRRYSTDKLMQHSRMQFLTRKEPSRMNEMLQSIVEASFGVFLWVRLVTESLLKGLTNHDNVEDLLERLKELPSDLYDLYGTLLSRVEISQGLRTAQLLQVVRDVGQPSLLDLWFALEADTDMVCNTPVAPIGDEEVSERVQELEWRIKNLSKGLVEVVPCDYISESDTGSLRVTYGLKTLIYDVSTEERRATARFIHRSVDEYLSYGQDGHTDFIVKYSPKHPWTSAAVLRSGILIIKTCNLSGNATWACLMRLVMLTADRLSRVDGWLRSPRRLDGVAEGLELLHEFDVAVRGIMPLVHKSSELTRDMEASVDNPYGASFITSQAVNVRPDPESHSYAWLRYVDLLNRGPAGMVTMWPYQDKWEAYMLTFAAEYGLNECFKSEIKKRGGYISKHRGYPFLLAALTARPRILYPEGQPIIRWLLDHGYDPKELYKGISVWQWYLWSNDELFPRRAYHYNIFISIARRLILAGSDPNAYTLYNPDPVSRFPYREKGRFRWYPRGIQDNSTVCTILLALTRVDLKPLITKSSGDEKEQWEEAELKRQNCIEILRERGAVEKEWKDWDSIEPIIREVNEKLERHESRQSSARVEEVTEKDGEAPAGSSAADFPADDSTAAEAMVTGKAESGEDQSGERPEPPCAGIGLTPATKKEEAGEHTKASSRSSSEKATATTVKNEDDVKRVDATTPVSDVAESQTTTLPPTTATKKSRIRSWFRKLWRAITCAV